MSDAQIVLLVEDDPLIAVGLAHALSRPGRRVIVCRDAESAEIVLHAEMVAAIVSDVKLSGPFRFDGLDFLGLARGRATGARLIGISGSNAEGLGQAVEDLGARFLQKPFAIEQLEAMLSEPPIGDGPSAPEMVPVIDEIIAAGQIVPKYQPIVRLDAPSILGFEALARLKGASVLSEPTALFAYAHRKSRSVDLNLACVRAALGGDHVLPSGALHFVNVDGRVFSSGRLAPILEREAERGVRLDRVVIELTEQHPFVEEEAAFAEVERIRATGIRFAFDDVGIAYSHLPLIGRIRPSFLKISQQFGTGFEEDAVRAKLVRNIVGLAHEFGCEVIIEGIESAATAAAARDAGIGFGQGYLFGRPSDPRSFDEEATLAAIRGIPARGEA